jgi:hypothetical protein
MAYLALDLATRTGWALWSRGNERPRFGTLRLSRLDAELIAPDLEKLRSHLSGLHAMEPIEAVFFEAPIMMRVDTLRKLQFLLGLVNMVEWWAYRLNIPCRQVGMDDWRKHFLGFSKGGREKLKAEAVAECRRRGWQVAGDDEADACGVLDYGLACFGISPPWRDGHMFGGALTAVAGCWPPTTK